MSTPKRSARSGIARSGATRAGYMVPAGPPSAEVIISIGGVPTGPHARRVLVESLAVHDALNEVPNTASFTVQGDRPAEGSDVVIHYLNTGARMFAGSIVRVTLVPVTSRPSNITYQVECIDWSWQLTFKLVSARYVGQLATAIGKDLVARYAPPSFTAAVPEGLPPIDEISFTMVSLITALSRLAARFGGYTLADYFKRVRLFETPDQAAIPTPIPLTLAHPTFANLNFSHTRDYTQIITRALVEGGGVNAAAAVPVGETRLPVDDIAWYQVSGGWVVSGPQRIRYAGVVPGGDGAMASAVGGQTGNTAPPSALTIGSQPGAGLPVGVYKYAYTWVTPTGECLPSPLATWNTASAGGPTAAPTTTPTGGTGLGIGRYRYAYTWVTATGETVPSPVGEATTGQTSVNAPSGAPAAVTQTGPGLTAGAAYKYALTFTTAAGETPGGPVTNPSVQTPTAKNNPTNTPSAVASASVTGTLTPGAVYAAAYAWAADTNDPPQYVTKVSPVVMVTAGAKGHGAIGNVLVSGEGGGRIWALRSLPGQTAPLYYTNYVNDAGSGGLMEIAISNLSDANLQQKGQAATVNSWAKARLLVSSLQLGPAGVTGRKLYRSAGGGSAMKLVATLSDNVATTYLDSTPDANLGAAMPTSNTTTISSAQITVTGIAVGPAGVTARRVYRTTVGGTALKLLTTINNNSATALSAPDAAADATLGAAAPTTGTAVLAQALLAAVAVGAAPTSKRRIYRTAVNGSALKLLTELANNTATTFGPDTTADASLGAAAPTTDSSGLVSGSGGFVPAGSTQIPVANVTPFAPEGWANVAGQMIRYHGVSATALTGIPATGPGSLGFSVPFNAPIAVVAQLTGVPASGLGAIAVALLAGDPVNLLAIAEDLDAQAKLASVLGGDGVVEDYTQDSRISFAEALSRAQADLDLKKDPLDTIRYRSRDPLTQSGGIISVDLPSPWSVKGDFQIQDVTIGGFTGKTGPLATYPWYTVVASSRRFSFEDLLRRRRG